MKKIRVLEIISGFAVEGPLGGIERFGIELAQALDPTLIEPIVCGLWAYGSPFEQQWVDRLRAKGINAFIAADWDEQAPYRSFWRAWQGMQTILQEPVDVIHSHCQFGDLLALLFKKRLKARRLIRTVHNEREWGKRPLRRLLLTELLYPWRFDFEVGVAQQVVDNLDRRLAARLLQRRSARLYNALNLARFQQLPDRRQATRERLGIAPEAVVIGSVGRLTAQKGYSYLLKAAPLILAQKPEAFFLLVGGGELEQSLQQEALELGLAHRILFTGPRNDVEELLASMDIFINSSLWEGLPTVILESMAAHLPVIATSVSGNQELISHGRTGLLVPPADREALTTAVITLMSLSPEAQQEMCRQAYRFVAENFTIHAVARQHELMYSHL
jgi:glycosyltransferase involved in cell wall biosynthesis